MLASLTVRADMLDDTGRFDIHGLNGVNSNPVPLLSIQFSASTDLMKGNALDVVASYRSIGVNQDSANLQYNELSHAFSVTAPRIKSLDFSDSIREKVEICPEKLLDKLIIDGAVGFNYHW